MKKFLFPLLVLSILVSVSSCIKCYKEERKVEQYYSTDFKELEGDILGVDIEDIDVLYSSFFYEGKTLRYKLVAGESSSEECFEGCGNALAYEEGEAIVDEELNITFVPDSNPTEVYEGYFENDKKNYKVSLPDMEKRELNFILKKKK